MNLGDGYVNIDAHPYTPDTLVCRFPPLPYEDGTVADVFTGHCLEHLSPPDVMPLLAECYRVLEKGGSLTVVVPDAYKARLLAESKRLTLEQLTAIVFGDSYDDMPHWTLLNRQRLTAMMEQAGFTIDAAYRWKDDRRVFDRAPIWQAGVRGVKS